MTEKKPVVELGWPEIAAIIFASQGITSGLWRLAVKMRFAALNMRVPEINQGETTFLALPTGIAAMEAIAIFPSEKPGSMIFDAAQPPVSQAKRLAKPAVKTKSAASKATKPRDQTSKTPPTVQKATARPTKKAKA